MTDPPPVRREFTEREEFASLRLEVVDLKELVTLMRDTIRGQCDVVIYVKAGRADTTYHDPAELESDTKLPDVVRNLIIVVQSPWEAWRTNEQLRLYFSGDRGAAITVIGSSETVVLGAKQRLSEFLRARQTRPSKTDRLYSNTFIRYGMYGAIIATSGVSGTLLGHSLNYQHLIAFTATLLALIVFSLYLDRLEKRAFRLRFDFSLIVRNQSQGTAKRFMTGDNLALIILALSLVVGIVAWLFPRTPVP
jgi:hypothetical protein